MPVDTFVNPEIIMGYRSPDLSGLDPSRMMANVLAYKQAKTQQQANALALQEAKQKAADQALLQEAANQSDPVNYLRGRDRLDLANTYAAQQQEQKSKELDYQTKQAALRKAVSEANKTELDNTLKTVQDRFAGVIANYPDLNSPEAIQAVIDISANAHSDPNLGRILNASGANHENTVLQLQNAVKNGTAPQFIKNMALGADDLRKGFMPITPEKQIELTSPDPKQIDVGGNIVTVDMNPNSKTYLQQLRSDVKTATASDRLAREKFEAEKEKGNFSPETIDFLADMFNQGAGLPTLGLGASGVKMQIIEKARQKSKEQGITSTDAASDVILNKQKLAAQQSTLKAFSSGIEARRTTSLNTAINHLQTMDRLADDLANSDLRIFNKAANLFSKETGSTAPTNFDAAKQIVAAEVIKAITLSPSGGTGGERERAEEQISKANTPKQLRDAINVYRELLGGQLQSLQLQYEYNTGRKDFTQRLSPNTRALLPSTSGGGAQTTPAAPVRVNSKADLDKLAPGAQYIGPDNIVRTKPKVSK